jgi:LuxR family maltose regulon positive regulatory protein
MGDAARQKTWAMNTARELNGKTSLARNAEFQASVAARVLLALGESEPAVRLSQAMYDSAVKEGRNLYAIEGALLRALGLWQLKKKKQWTAALSESLDLAEQAGAVRLYLDLGEPVRVLLSEYMTLAAKSRSKKQARLVGYAQKLLDAYSPVGVDSPRSSLPEPLSPREMQVLKLVVSGASNQEIANELVVTVATVKAHTNTIYSKLGVSGRTQAIRRAHELHLV